MNYIILLLHEYTHTFIPNESIYENISKHIYIIGKYYN